MDEGQIKELISQLTVRIKSRGTTEEGKNITEKGTGVLLLQNNRAYVLTVYHCIYGVKEPFHKVAKESIKFSFLSTICSELLNPINITPLKQNLVLLKIDINKLNKTDMECYYLDRVYDGKQYYLRGFPKSEVHNFKAECNDKDFDEVTFKIDVDRLTDDTSGIKANEFIKGLSGSGVFFSENNQLYLVGLTNELRDKYAKFNTVHCTKLVDLDNSDINFDKRLIFEDYDKNIQIEEIETLRYKNQLIKAYNSDSKSEIMKVGDIGRKYMIHFKNAEKSFHKIEVLRRFTRDTSRENKYENFQDDMYQDIMPTLLFYEYKNDFRKVLAVEAKSSNANTELYPLETKKCEKIEKIGVCHHLVEDEIIDWVDDE